MFSPHYARALERGPQPADQHLAINVALYGRREAWAFVEQAAQPGGLTPERLQVGESVCTQVGRDLHLQVALPRGLGRRPLRGKVVLRAGAGGAPRPLLLDARGRHRWWPKAPCARVEADFPELGVRFAGRGYHDVNFGDEPLAQGFASWQWMRTVGAKESAVHYVAQLPNGQERRLDLAFTSDGRARRRPGAPMAPLRSSAWGIARAAPRAWRIVRALTDTPFYVRSLLRARGEAYAMHEALDMRRWSRGWVRFLLPFRLLRLGR